MYYDFLLRADEGTDEGILSWCQYVLSGLIEEIEKLDKLLDYPFLRDRFSTFIKLIQTSKGGFHYLFQ
jgi:hypothetical protein